MKLAEFLRLLDLLGPDLKRWPPAKEAQAETLLASSDEATAAIFDAIRLDWILQSCRATVDEAVVDRIIGRLSAYIERPDGRFLAALRTWGLVPLWPRVSFLAAALAIGILAGVLQEMHAANAPFLDRVAWLLFDSYPRFPSER
jgi:hypothetical protein